MHGKPRKWDGKINSKENIERATDTYFFKNNWSSCYSIDSSIKYNNIYYKIGYFLLNGNKNTTCKSKKQCYFHRQKNSLPSEHTKIVKEAISGANASTQKREIM